MYTETLPQAQQEIQDPKFEIIEQVVAENFDWTRRIYRRIKVAGWTLTTFRSHFKDCPTVEAELSEAKPIKAGTVSKSPAESAQGFINSHLNGRPKQKKRRARKRQKPTPLLRTFVLILREPIANQGTSRKK